MSLPNRSRLSRLTAAMTVTRCGLHRRRSLCTRVASADELLRQLPEPLGVARVEGVGGDAGVACVRGAGIDNARFVAVLEVAAPDPVELWRGRNQDARRSALFDRLEPQP